MIPENIKNIIAKVERILSISIRGNQEYAENYNTKKSFNLIDDHIYHFDDRKFIANHFPTKLDDDLEYDYELRLQDTFCIYTKDLGRISLDFGVDEYSAFYDSIDIDEDSPAAQILYDYLTAILEEDKWNTDDLNDLTKED